MNINDTYYTIFIRPQDKYIDANGGMTADQGAAMLMSKAQAEERVEYLRYKANVNAIKGIYRPAWRRAVKGKDGNHEQTEQIQIRQTRQQKAGT